MAKKELVELFTTSELLRSILESDILLGAIVGKQNPPQVLEHPMYSFSDLPLKEVITRLREIDSNLSPADSYEVRSVDVRSPGRYVALRRDGVLATSQDAIKRLLYSKSMR